MGQGRSWSAAGRAALGLTMAALVVSATVRGAAVEAPRTPPSAPAPRTLPSALAPRTAAPSSRLAPPPSEPAPRARARPAAAHATFAVVAYVFPQNRLLAPGEVAARKLTRINYAFAQIEDGRFAAGSADDEQNLATLSALKRENPALTVLVSVGGWLGSGSFSTMALSRRSRAVFIQSAVAFVERNHLDGLDIDWEYPGLPGAGNPFRPQDKENYTRLLRELRHRLQHEEKKLHRRLYLTIATGASPLFLAHTEMGQAAQYVDTVNLMAYDYYEPDDDRISGNHAPLYTDPRDPKRVSADRSVRAYEAAGVPAAKILLGVPFYGHAWGEVADVHHGLFQPGKQVARAAGQYGDIAALLQHGFTRYWDGAAAVPYLYSPTAKVFVSYEDAESVAGKCRYVVRHRLGGVMFWAYSDQAAGIRLLDAVDAGLGVGGMAVGEAK